MQGGYDYVIDVFRKIEENPLEADVKLQCAQERLWEISCSNREQIMNMLDRR